MKHDLYFLAWLINTCKNLRKYVENIKEYVFVHRVSVTLTDSIRSRNASIYTRIISITVAVSNTRLRSRSSQTVPLLRRDPQAVDCCHWRHPLERTAPAVV